MPKHTVQSGDCFNSIAKQHGFYNYLTVFSHGTNNQVCGPETNPNMLVEGVEVDVPEKKVKKIAAKLNAEQQFVILRQKTKLRIQVADKEWKPLATSTYSLKVGTLDQTKPDGFKDLLDAEIDPSVKTGKLTITIPPPVPAPVTPPAVAVAGPAPAKPPHPPKYKAEDFKDKEADRETAPVTIEWTLQVGALEALKEVRGGLQRLNNLGCLTPDPSMTKTEDDKTRRVVKSFQKNEAAKKDTKLDDPSGAIADIKDDLKKAHDNA